MRRLAVAEHLAQRRNVNAQRAVIDVQIGPDESHQRVASDQFAGALDQCHENAERPAAQPDHPLPLTQYLLRGEQLKWSKGPGRHEQPPVPHDCDDAAPCRGYTRVPKSGG